jgi:hypothetical protein
MKRNDQLIIIIDSKESIEEIDSLDIAGILRQQRNSLQINKMRHFALFAAAYGGFIDGPYLYMGIISLVTMTGPMLIATSIICTIFVLSCIITRIFEEYNYQIKLARTQNQVELAVQLKHLEIKIRNFYLSIDGTAQISREKAQITIDVFNTEINNFLIKCNEFTKTFLIKANWQAFLMGIHDGLLVYGSLASLTFAAATLCAIVATPLPAMFLLIGTIIGLACLGGFAGFYVHKNRESLFLKDLNVDITRFRLTLLLLGENYHDAVAEHFNVIIKRSIVESTKCPVNAALIAICAVSASRISPSIITSGS